MDATAKARDAVGSSYTKYNKTKTNWGKRPRTALLRVRFGKSKQKFKHVVLGYELNLFHVRPFFSSNRQPSYVNNRFRPTPVNDLPQKRHGLTTIGRRIGVVENGFSKIKKYLQFTRENERRPNTEIIDL